MDPLGASIVQETRSQPVSFTTQRVELPPPTPQKPVPPSSPLPSPSPQTPVRATAANYDLPPSATFPVSPRTPSSAKPLSPRSPFNSEAHLPSAQRVNLHDDGPPPAAKPPPAEPREAYVKIRVLGMDRAKKDVWVKLDAASNLPAYHSTHIKAFSRSFAEFVALHMALTANHPQAIVPAVPIPATSAATEDEEDRLLKLQFQRWVDRITRNPDLIRDEELRSFLEANFGVR
jgi:hypothetical protein